MQESTRLNKFLALHLGISRREADSLIEQGSVTVNDTVASIGQRALSTDTIRVDDDIVSHDTQSRYIALHKPVGYVCSRRAQGDNETVYALLPPDYHSLKLVGRLDKDSSGIILLTNDGDFAYQMTHPKFFKQKIYEVTLDQPMQPLHRQMISDRGISLEDGASQFELERLNDGDDTAWRITMSEGRNRQIRRTFAALGYETIRLHRTRFGQYDLGTLAPGEMRLVTTSSSLPKSEPPLQ